MNLELVYLNLKLILNSVCNFYSEKWATIPYHNLPDNFTTQHLRDLERYLEEDKHGKSMNELYELVQYAANILPRLYLLITVGAVFIKKKKSPANEVLRDLVEMCPGVQHPLRGLFLRTYLAEMTRDKLPEKGSEYAENGGGDVNDCIEFILKNFVEMNKLWVRMRHQGQVREKNKVDDERRQLSILVGKNISRISALEGVDEKLYKVKILPAILKQITQCKDAISQQYLMVILIQVIPDDWHLKTLKTLLRTVVKLEKSVDIKPIVTSLFDRLGDYIKAEKIKEDYFSIFLKNTTDIIQKSKHSPKEENGLSLLLSLFDLVVKCYDGNIDYVNQILGLAVEVLVNVTPEQQTRQVSDQIFKLLRQTLETVKDVVQVLKLEKYHHLAIKFAPSHRRRIAVELATYATGNSIKITSNESCQQYLEFIGPLFTEDLTNELDEEDLAQERALISSSIHLIGSEDIEEYFSMILGVAKFIENSSTKNKTSIYTSLVFSLLRLVRFIHSLKGTEKYHEKAVGKVFMECNKVITALQNNTESKLLVLNLYITCAQAAAHCGEDTLAERFFSDKALAYYEEISVSKDQFDAIRQLVGGALSIKDSLTPESYENIAIQISKISNALVQTKTKCRALGICSHLFYKQDDLKLTLKILTQSLKVASSSMDDNIATYIELLNDHLYYFIKFDQKEELQQRIEELIQRINESFEQTEKPSGVDPVRRYYEATRLAYELKKEELGQVPQKTSKVETKQEESVQTE